MNMTTDFTATEPTYWVAHGEGLAFGRLETGERISTGQPVFETYTNAQYLLWRGQVIALGGDPEGVPV